MKVLNLYSGIGGNRKLWPEDVEVTAVEYREDIANVYRHHFPNDTVIVTDAHQYLLDHYQEFDFIWSSYPCQKNSRANFWASKTATNRKKYYPGLGLYEEIIFLEHWFKGGYVVENTVPYYKPLMLPTNKLGRHLFWSNFEITPFAAKDADIHGGNSKEWKELFGFDLSHFKIDSRKDQIYRNCVHPETGLHILDCFRGKIKSIGNQQELFKTA